MQVLILFLLVGFVTDTWTQLYSNTWIAAIVLLLQKF